MLFADRRGVAGRARTTRSGAVVFPVVGGEQTLRELVAEFKTTGPEYRRTVQTTLQASYTNHYRRGLIRAAGGAGVPLEQHHPPAGASTPWTLIGRYAGGAA